MEECRAHGRNEQSAGMEISLFGCGGHRRSDAKLLNYGRDGICFLSRQAFPTDAIVFLRIKGKHPVKKNEAGVEEEAPRNGTLAKIRWVRPAEENGFPFRIGAVYYPLSEVNV